MAVLGLGGLGHGYPLGLAVAVGGRSGRTSSVAAGASQGSMGGLMFNADLSGEVCLQQSLLATS